MHFRRAKEKNWSSQHPLGPPLRLKIEGTTHLIQPREKMRYLGFFLNPKLTFREHIRFYANKATSTVQALRMLGNAARGLAPKDKRRLYISNVIPVLAYGAHLWWRPQWKGRKWIAQTLQKAQNRGARWITGGFRTTPTGSLEMMAGLLPIKHQIDKFMAKAGLRTTVLHDAHPIRALFPPENRPHTQEYRAPLPLTGKKSKDGESPIAYQASMSQRTTETFEPLNEECQPGNRIVDTYSERITHHMGNIEGHEAPPKAQTDNLKDWINAHLNLLIMSLEEDENATLVFMDGSQKQGDNQNQEVRAGAAWRTIHQGRTKEGHFGCGRATPYDAEMAALARGIKEATRAASGEKAAIHVFADNKAALASILKTKLGPAQTLSIAACRAVREWLDQGAERSIHMWWCPGHRGILHNTQVDRQAGVGAEEVSAETSFAYARQQVTASIYAAWRKDMETESYRGNNNLIINEDGFKLCKHTAANWFIRKGGGNSEFFARLTRYTSGHFPHGHFRERFHLEGPRECWCGKIATETREHIWYDCELWIREHCPKEVQEASNVSRQGRGTLRSALDFRSPTPEGMTSREHAYLEWKKEPVDMEQVATFLQQNPAIATFKWANICQNALEDLERGRHQSPAIYKADLHTRIRKRAYEAWKRRHPKGPIAEFNKIWGRTALDQLDRRGELNADNFEENAMEVGFNAQEARRMRREYEEAARKQGEEGDERDNEEDRQERREPSPAREANGPDGAIT